jgi:hypothetical protein
LQDSYRCELELTTVLLPTYPTISSAPPGQPPQGQQSYGQPPQQQGQGQYGQPQGQYGQPQGQQGQQNQYGSVRPSASVIRASARARPLNILAFSRLVISAPPGAPPGGQQQYGQPPQGQQQQQYGAPAPQQQQSHGSVHDLPHIGSPHSSLLIVPAQFILTELLEEALEGR